MKYKVALSLFVAVCILLTVFNCILDQVFESRLKDEEDTSFVVQRVDERVEILKKYDRFSCISDPYTAVCLDGKWGFINSECEEVVPCIYTEIGDLSDGLRRVCLDHKWGYIDSLCKEIVPCVYDDARSFCEGMACVYRGGKLGFIDKQGNEVIPCRYDKRRIIKICYFKKVL